MRARRLLILAALLAVLAAVAVGVRLIQRGRPSHSTDDARAPGSVDAWPSVPRPAGD